MSSLARKLLEAANKTDGFEAWELAPIAAEYIRELEAQRDELLKALEKVYTVMNDDMPVALRKICYEAIAKAKGE